MLGHVQAVEAGVFRRRNEVEPLVELGCQSAVGRPLNVIE